MTRYGPETSIAGTNRQLEKKDKTMHDSIITTTTGSIEGRPVQRYLGIVAGEVIVGANIVRDVFASITDIVGGRSGKYEDVLARARNEAFSEIRSEAIKHGGNAVIGVSIDYEVIGQSGSMLMVAVSGTVVIV